MKTLKNEPTLTPEQLKAEIEERNKAFAAADEAGKRVLIAKDVIKLLDTKKLEAARGCFIDTHTHNDPFDGTEDVRELFLQGQLPDCEVCGVGALMLSCTLFNDKQTMSDIWNEDISYRINYSEPLSNGLNAYFDRDQLMLIENAFELGSGAFDWQFLDHRNAAIAFGRKYPQPKDRLIAIMENIIKNKGEFKP